MGTCAGRGLAPALEVVLGRQQPRAHACQHAPRLRPVRESCLVAGMQPLQGAHHKSGALSQCTKTGLTLMLEPYTTGRVAQQNKPAFAWQHCVAHAHLPVKRHGWCTGVIHEGDHRVDCQALPLCR